jgi:hypothetical protein
MITRNNTPSTTTIFGQYDFLCNAPKISGFSHSRHQAPVVKLRFILTLLGSGHQNCMKFTSAEWTVENS